MVMTVMTTTLTMSLTKAKSSVGMEDKAIVTSEMNWTLFLILSLTSKRFYDLIPGEQSELIISKKL